MGFGDGFSRPDKGNRWCPTHEESSPCSKCAEKEQKEQEEIAEAKKLHKESVARVEKNKTADVPPKERPKSYDVSIVTLGVKVDKLHQIDLKNVIDLITSGDKALPPHLRALGDAYRSIPESKPLPPAMIAMLKQMRKPLPPEQTTAERLKKALTKMSDDQRMEISKFLNPHISRSESRDERAA